MANQVKTGIVRFSYLNVFEPKAVQGSESKKYSVSLIIPKSDTATITAIEEAVEAALKDGVAKFGGKIPPRGSLKLPLRDGDTERDDEAYADSYFINANANEDHKPQVIDRAKRVLTSTAELWSGCYGKAIIQFYPYNVNGNRGVACGLVALMKTDEGAPLSGSHVDAFEAFSDDFEAADDDLLS